MFFSLPDPYPQSSASKTPSHPDIYSGQYFQPQLHLPLLVFTLLQQRFCHELQPFSLGSGSGLVNLLLSLFLFSELISSVIIYLDLLVQCLQMKP